MGVGHEIEMAQVSYGLHVHQLPDFVDQVAENDRRAPIASGNAMTYGIGADTSISGNVFEVGVYTEQEALVQTKLFLEDALTDPHLDTDITEQARDIYKNLSFIGEKELTTATQAITEYWKKYLIDNPQASIFVITSKTFAPASAESDDEPQEADDEYISDNKSDSYVIDNVLGNFSDEELQEYSGRLLLTASEFARRKPGPVKTVILDDWIMSGQQIQDTLDTVFEHTEPEDLEINLVVCNEVRLADGISHGKADDPIPVKAHFLSRKATHSESLEFGQAYLTGTHSSGDYPFEGTIENIVEAINQSRTHQEDVVHMPPLANIIRPYYSPGYRFEHIERHATIGAVGRVAVTA